MKKEMGICNKCMKESGCEYKLSEERLTLVRCLDFAAKENIEEKK